MDRHALEQVKLRFYITTVFRIPCKHIFASKIPTFLDIPQKFEFYKNFNIMETLDFKRNTVFMHASGPQNRPFIKL